MAHCGWLRSSRVFVGLLLLLVAGAASRAADKIQFTQETLPNGLRVIYAPLHQAPVIHVQVLYHVGSKDETPDCQGFAHMFEHMMFRGSAHVKPEEHMKLISTVGGYCNAFTSFDQTVYVNTIPANQLDLALYLEADRMASFKVSDTIYKTERQVVGEEWGRQQNQPYGTMFQDFLKLAYTTHHYQWSPIGNMSHLAAAGVDELQEFFNTYYIPNNAVLVIAGDFDPAAAKAMVAKDFAWIPRGKEIVRNSPPEPPQTKGREEEIARAVPLPAIMIGYHIPPYKSSERHALGLLGTIMGGGESSRLHRALVSSQSPLCANVHAMFDDLEDGGFGGAMAIVLAGKDPAEVEKIMLATVADLGEKGVTPEELEKAKTQARLATIRGQQTAEKIAGELGTEALLANDPNRVNTDLEEINAVTAADVQAAARKYLVPTNGTTLRVKPNLLAGMGRPASQPASAPVVASTRPVTPREVKFPEGYPTTPPLGTSVLACKFAKGTEADGDGMKVIVMPDSRLPLVSWTLVLRRGDYLEPAGKEGLASLTAALMKRGTAAFTYAQLGDALESRGISIDIASSGDTTRISGSCLSEQLAKATEICAQILWAPTFPADELAKLKQQTLSNLMRSRENPETVAGIELQAGLWGDSPLGRTATPQSIASITLDDVKDWYKQIYQLTDAFIVVSGDVTVERGQELAKKLQAKATPAPAKPTYNFPPAATARRIILVDRPEGKQSTIRMGNRAYDIFSEDKFAGSVADRTMGHGIESRLGKSVRAEKGYAYSVWGSFGPSRQAGTFTAGAETSFKNTADAIEAMFKVFEGMRSAEITPAELADTKMRLTGSMVMGMQTIQQQASYRIEGILNNYPADYYDNYPERINAVTGEKVKQVCAKWITPDAMTIVVVAPAAEVKEQLSRLGKLEVVPMPARRGATQPAKGD